MYKHNSLAPLLGLSESGQIFGKGYLPVGRVVFQLSRVAGADMGGRDFVLSDREMHQVVHFPHHNHVSIQEDDPLSKKGLGHAGMIHLYVHRNLSTRMP